MPPLPTPAAPARPRRRRFLALALVFSAAGLLLLIRLLVRRRRLTCTTTTASDADRSRSEDAQGQGHTKVQFERASTPPTHAAVQAATDSLPDEDAVASEASFDSRQGSFASRGRTLSEISDESSRNRRISAGSALRRRGSTADEASLGVVRKLSSTRVHEEDPEQFAAFVSHAKAEAAMEARFIQEKLEDSFGRLVFLDR